jgi:hypothetical protein
VYGQQDPVDVGAHEPIAVGGACGRSIDTAGPPGASHRPHCLAVNTKRNDLKYKKHSTWGNYKLGAHFVTACRFCPRALSSDNRCDSVVFFLITVWKDPF